MEHVSFGSLYAGREIDDLQLAVEGLIDLGKQIGKQGLTQSLALEADAIRLDSETLKIHFSGQQAGKKQAIALEGILSKVKETIIKVYEKIVAGIKWFLGLFKVHFKGSDAAKLLVQTPSLYLQIDLPHTAISQESFALEGDGGHSGFSNIELALLHVPHELFSFSKALKVMCPKLLSDFEDYVRKFESDTYAGERGETMTASFTDVSDDMGALKQCLMKNESAHKTAKTIIEREITPQSVNAWDKGIESGAHGVTDFLESEEFVTQILNKITSQLNQAEGKIARLDNDDPWVDYHKDYARTLNRCLKVCFDVSTFTRQLTASVLRLRVKLYRIILRMLEAYKKDNQRMQDVNANSAVPKRAPVDKAIEEIVAIIHRYSDALANMKFSPT